MKNMPAQLLAAFFALAIGARVNAEELRDASVIQLIANPILLNGKEVRVIGFLHLEFEGNAVYLHREDFEKSIAQNSVAIELTESQERIWRKMNNHYVIIEGRFNSVAQGHLSARAGTLQQISRLSDWSANRSRRKQSD